MERFDLGDRPLAGDTDAASSDYTIDVSPSIPIPERTLSVDGSEYTVSSIGRVKPGDDLTVTVTAPASEDYQIQLRDPNKFVWRVSAERTGDATVTIPTGETETKDTLAPGPYGVAPVDGGNAQAFHPVVILGYDVAVQAAPRGIADAPIDIEATLSEVQRDVEIPPVDDVEAVVYQPDWDRRFPLSHVDGDTYRSPAAVPAGEYDVSVVATETVPTEDGTRDDPLAFSEPQPLSTVDASTRLTPAWRVAVDGRVQGAAPAVDDTRVIVGGLGSEIRTANRSDGSTRWTFDRTGSLSDSGPVLADGTVIVGSGGGYCYGLETGTTAERVAWRVDLGSAVTSTAAVGTERVYVGTNDGRVHAIDPAQESVAWAKPVGGPVYTTLEPGPSRIFVTTDSGDVVALRFDGAEEWRRSVGPGDGTGSPVRRDGTVYVAGGDLFALAAADGTTEWWGTDYGGSVGSTPTVEGGEVFVGDADGRVTAVDATTGSQRWRFDIGHGVASRPAVTADRVVAADLSGTLVSLDRTGGTAQVAGTVESAVRAPLVLDSGTVFVGTRAGDVEAHTGLL